MKKRLLKKLEQPKIDRNFKWFWKTYIKTKIDNNKTSNHRNKDTQR